MLGLICRMSFVGAFRRLTVSRSAMAIAGGLAGAGVMNFERYDR